MSIYTMPLAASAARLVTNHGRNLWVALKSEFAAPASVPENHINGWKGEQYGS